MTDNNKAIKPYFNNHQQPYTRRLPPWYDAASVVGVAQLEAASAVIRAELVANLADPVRAKRCFQKYRLTHQQGWRQIELLIYGVAYPQRMQLFPRTMEVLRQIPGVSTAYFSILSAATEVPAHVGDTDGYYRVHLGLEVPAGLPDCGLEVAGMVKAWQQDKCLVFNDAYYHTAWNHADKNRVVLIVDIIRPEFRAQKVFVDAGVRATLYWSRIYAFTFPLVELLPRLLTRLIRPSFHGLSYGWHRCRLWLKKEKY